MNPRLTIPAPSGLVDLPSRDNSIALRFIETLHRTVWKLSKGVSISIGKGTSFVENSKVARGAVQRLCELALSDDMVLALEEVDEVALASSASRAGGWEAGEEDSSDGDGDREDEEENGWEVPGESNSALDSRHENLKA